MRSTTRYRQLSRPRQPWIARLDMGPAQIKQAAWHSSCALYAAPGVRNTQSGPSGRRPPQPPPSALGLERARDIAARFATWPKSPSWAAAINGLSRLSSGLNPIYAVEI
jgi:hypothetical protein